MKEGFLLLEPRNEEGLKEEFEKLERHKWLFLSTEKVGRDLQKFLKWWDSQDGKVMMMGDKATQAIFSNKILKLIVLTNMDSQVVRFNWMETVKRGEGKLPFAMVYAGMEFEEAKELLNKRMEKLRERNEG